jgi:hypothetical protein
MKEPHQCRPPVGSRKESGPPGTHPRLTGQPAPDKKQPHRGAAQTVQQSPPSAGGSNLAGEEAGEDFGWFLPVEDLTGSAVDLAGDCP